MGWSHFVGENVVVKCTSRLSLGTAQFGLPYGIANSDGQVPTSEAHQMLDRAYQHGIRKLDTASLYGSSEAVIGSSDKHDWVITTKIAGLPADCGDIAGWVAGELKASLNALQIEAVDTVLLHRPDDLLGSSGKELYDALAACRANGLCKRLGVSLYSADEADPYLEHYALDTIQLPFSLVDRRLVTAGRARELNEAGISIQVRSIFLQGLLLMGVDDQVQRFPRAEPLWRAFAAWCSERGVTAHEACLRFALGQADLDAIIVGVDSAAQLDALLEMVGAGPLAVPDDLATTDRDIIDPRRWL